MKHVLTLLPMLGLFYWFLPPTDPGLNSPLPATDLFQDSTIIICEGEVIEIGDTTINQSGNYQVLLPAMGGPDTIMLEVIVQPTYEEAINVALCEGETFRLGDTLISTTGTYQRTLVSALGCDSVIFAEVNVFSTYNIRKDTTICEGESFVFGNFTVNRAGVYTQTFTSTENCDSTVTLDVIVRPPDRSRQSLEVCPGELVNETPVFRDTTLFFTFPNVDGCDSVVIYDIQVEGLTPEIVAEGPVCRGENSGFLSVAGVQSGSPPYLYSLAGGPFQTMETFTGLGAGSYTLRIQDVEGCTLDTLLTLEEPSALNLELGPDREIVLGDTVQLNARIDQPVSQYIWRPEEGLSCTDCPDPIANPIASTTYSLRIFDENNCETQTSITITVSTIRKVYVPNVFSPNGDELNDYFTLYTGEGVRRIRQFKIFDRWGRLVFAREDQDPNALSLRWDGRTQGPDVVQSVYTWFAEIEFRDGISEVFEGSVLLVK